MGDYINLDVNEYGGCTLKMQREFRKGRGNPSQHKKHKQGFNLYREGLGLAVQMLQSRLELGPQFSARKKNMSDDDLKAFIQILKAELADELTEKETS